MHVCTIISLISFVLGLAVNVVVLLSLPFFPGVSIYIAEIDYTNPLNGTLNGIFTFHNLTSLRVSLAAFLLNYDRFGLLFLPVG